MDTDSRSSAVEYHDNGSEKESHYHLIIQKSPTIMSSKDMFNSFSTHFLIFVTFFLFFLHCYFKFLSRRKTAKIGSVKLEKENERIYGLNDVVAIKPFIPINLIGNVPHFLPVKGKSAHN